MPGQSSGSGVKASGVSGDATVRYRPDLDMRHHPIPRRCRRPALFRVQPHNGGVSGGPVGAPRQRERRQGDQVGAQDRGRSRGAGRTVLARRRPAASPASARFAWSESRDGRRSRPCPRTMELFNGSQAQHKPCITRLHPPVAIDCTVIGVNDTIADAEEVGEHAAAAARLRKHKVLALRHTAADLR